MMLIIKKVKVGRKVVIHYVAENANDTLILKSSDLPRPELQEAMNAMCNVLNLLMPEIPLDGTGYRITSVSIKDANEDVGLNIHYTRKLSTLTRPQNANVPYFELEETGDAERAGKILDLIIQEARRFLNNDRSQLAMDLDEQENEYVEDGKVATLGIQAA